MQHVVENVLFLKRPAVQNNKQLHDSHDESDDGSVTKNNVE